jgi:hypothetical protein
MKNTFASPGKTENSIFSSSLFDDMIDTKPLRETKVLSIVNLIKFLF